MDSMSLGYNHQLPGSSRVALNHHEHMRDTETSIASSSYEVWNNFFLSAGIPMGVANNYAVTFSQHRIRIDMLKDITKEILLDMGIKAMGDIIAILRHAKDICAQNELKGSMSVKAPSSKVSSNNVNTISPRVQPTPRQTPHNMPQLNQTKPTRNSPSGSGTIAAHSMSGNKIQSRLNLNSGALISAQHKQQHHQFGSDTSGNKRSSTSISDSLSKRLKPSPVTSDPRYTEKTLTVILPSTSATRMGNKSLYNNDNVSMPPNKTQASSSIKSRLGAVPDSAKASAETSSTLLTYSASRIQSRQSDLRSSLNSGNRAQTSTNPNNHDYHHIDLNKKQQSNTQIHRQSNDRFRKDHDDYSKSSRSKSAVFSRLR